EQWSRTTTTGDLAEMEGLDERSSVIPLVTSSRENCLGTECPEYRQCHVMKARREAMLADLVVVNHHLFFADMSLRDSGVAELLPSVEVAVFDEGAETGNVRWIDLTPHQCRLVESPLDIREALREQMASAPKAWVFTSATLGDDERLSWFTESAGLTDEVTLRVGSPFDYASH